MKISEKKILDILEKYEFKGMRKSTGGNVIAFCPFHENNKTPSFSINVKTGLWCCFSGECGAKGNLVKLIMKLESCGYEEALKVLYEGSENIVYEMMLDNLDFSGEQKIEKSNPLNIKLYPAEIESIPGWKKHLEKINIKPEIAIKAGIKLCKNKYAKDDMVYLNKLIIPVYDKNRNLLDNELRRWLPSDLGKKVIYLPGSKMKELVYGFGIVRDYPSTCIIVEGTKDALTLIGYGYFCLSLFGTKISRQKIGMMLSSGIKKVIIMLDDDDAGIKAQKKIAEECSNFFDTVEVKLEQGKDPNDLTEEEFLEVVRNNPVIKEAKYNGY